MTVSVLLPYRDVASTLAEAMESILAEDEDLELIAIDDGSNDGSERIAAGFRSERVRLLRSPHRGLPATLSFGLSHARGEWVARMDGDDLSLPGRLRAQREFLEKNGAIAALGTCVEAFGEVGEGMRRYVEWQSSL